MGKRQSGARRIWNGGETMCLAAKQLVFCGAQSRVIQV
ncbi:hypothetical protein SAMN05444002_0083 [Vannielia litorea]|uniref:Uncharacterized protein n=1 Tax=Vannielia litorea TaxID=1217970 RepID=A0A1N6DWN2_9RHOB|nr:hypothetical protein SAMN05444002_0083 [Vannielia litorea]